MISEVFNEDCMIGMARYPEKYFDLAIVDPPYKNIFRDMHNVNPGNIAKAKEYKYNTLNNSKPDKNYFQELFRVSKNQIIWGVQYFIDFLTETNCLIVWDKQIDGNFSDAEIAWTSFGSATRIFVFKWAGMPQEDMKNKEVRIHPTQKPVALYRYLLHNYAKPEDKILDTHLGSGSSRIAAHDMDFDFWGWEIDKDYFDAQEKRYQDHIKQQKLF